MQATFSHYRILEQIGEGGMGVVYRAHDEGALDRDVAVKVLPPGALADEAARRRFRKEATALSKLNHPNIATVFDFDSDNGTDFLVEELIPGLSLSEMLISGPLPEREIVNLGSQLCEGLAAAHEQGVIHRDLKPANVRVTPDARLKILDFGLAKLLPGRDARQGVSMDATASLTETQTVSGTFPYMAPEQLLNEKLDPRTDIWSVGCVLYEMTTGQRPFLGYGPALIDAILHQPPAAPGKLNRKLSPGLEAIVLKCLEKDPALRYASARDIAVDLHRLSTGTVTKALAARRKARVLKIGAAIALLFAVGMTALVWYRARTRKVGGPKVIAVLYFKNVSQDPSLDWLNGGLTEMLTTNLGQVQGLEVLSTDRIASIRKRLKIKPDKELTAESAPEVAREAGADAFVTGALMRLGPTRLRADVRLQDASTGRLLFSDKVESADINGIFSMVDAITTRLAERSAAPPQPAIAAPDIQQVATSNPEAYRHYQAGLDYGRRVLHAEAVREYQEAVRLDPQFALAYLRLADFIDAVDPAKTPEMIAAVERLYNRLPRLAQLEFEALKADRAGDLPRAIEKYELLLQEAPRDGFARMRLAQELMIETDPKFRERGIALLREGLDLDSKDSLLWNQLAYSEAWAGHEAAAIEACERYQALLGPNEPNPWSTRGDVLFLFGRNEEAAAAYRKVYELKPDFATYSPLVALAVIHSDSGDIAQARRELRDYRERTSEPNRLAARMLEGQFLESQGEPEAALQVYRRLVTEFMASRQSPMAGVALRRLTRNASLVGQTVSAIAFARQQHLKGEELTDVLWLQAAMGDEKAADRTLQEYSEATHPSPAAVQALREEAHRFAALARGDSVQATQDWASVRTIYYPFWHARVLLLAKDYANAEQMFKITVSRHRWLSGILAVRTRSPLIEHLCHFHLGQIYEATSRRNDAIREYRSFLSHYTKSRSRLPEIAQARAALKRLGAS